VRRVGRTERTATSKNLAAFSEAHLLGITGSENETQYSPPWGSSDVKGL